MTPSVLRFLQQICGEYSNQEQAFENPPFFAHIFLRYTPLLHLKPGSILLEQTYAVDPSNPYRLRVIRAEERSPGVIKLWNHTFKDPDRFAEASLNAECRRQIKESDLISMDQCHYQVTEVDGGYRGAMEPGCQCIVRRNGKDTVLVSTFHLKDDALETLDRGHDPVTHERCWGSIAGEFRFLRTKAWAEEIPSQWT